MMEEIKVKIEKELCKFLNNVKEKIIIKSVILFGSRARGDFSPYSDIDLIIIGDFKEKFLKRAINLLILNESKYNFEIFCYTEDEFESMFTRGNALIFDAIYEGIPFEGKLFFESYKNRMNEMIQRGLKRSKCTWILL